MDLPFLLALVFGGIFASLIWLGFRLVPARVPVRENQRTRRRSKIGFRAQLYWEGCSTGSLTARGVDFHENGALVLAKRPAAPGTLLFAQFDTFNLAGFAYVRHCRKKRFRYAIGLEFRGALLREHMSGWGVQHTPGKWNNGVIG